jgi:hypothetical protein
LTAVALIALIGLRVAQPQNSLPSAPSGSSTSPIPSAPAFSQASDEQISERLEFVGAARKPHPFDPGSAADNTILSESDGAKANWPAVDRLLAPATGRLAPGVKQRLAEAGSFWGFDDSIGDTRSRNAADNSILPESDGAKAPNSPAMDRLLAPATGRLAPGVKQRLAEAGSFWGFDDSIGDTRSRNAGRDSPWPGATGVPEAGDRRTQRKRIATSSDPSSTARRTELSPQPHKEAVIAPSLRADQPGRGIRAEYTFVGGWADNFGDCQEGQDQGAPLVISAQAAKTSGGECEFRSVTREATSRWHIVAQCASEGKSWRANIDLKLAGPNLTWSSERGTETYVRCLKR